MVIGERLGRELRIDALAAVRRRSVLQRLVLGVAQYAVYAEEATPPEKESGVCASP